MSHLPLSIHLLTDTKADSITWIVNSATTKMNVHISLSYVDLEFFKYIPKCGVGGWHDGSVVIALAAVSDDTDSIPSIHTVIYSYL